MRFVHEENGRRGERREKEKRFLLPFPHSSTICMPFPTLNLAAGHVQM
jgi:hypothetical protein